MRRPPLSGLLLLLGVALTACSKPGDAPAAASGKSPADVYLEYHARAAAGMSFEEDASFYSSRAVAAVEGKIESLMERTGKTREETIALYLALSKGGAECSELTLSEERIEGDTAFLEFDIGNTCPEEASDISKHKVKLVREDGWKLDEVEIVL